MAITNDILAKLDTKEIHLRWKPQSTYSNDTKCICVPYIDARDVMKTLDDVLGKSNRQDRYTQIGQVITCDIGINVDGNWIRKSDSGNSKDTDEKSMMSGAFKRAAVKRGVGRFIYDVPNQYLDCKKDGKRVVPLANGTPIKDLSKHINDLLAKQNDNAR